MIKFIKQLFCRHDYEIEEYFFGDMKNYGRGLEIPIIIGLGMKNGTMLRILTY